MSLDFLRGTEPFKRLSEAVHLGQKGLEITGLIEPAKPFLLASLLTETKKKIVFIRPSYSNLNRIEEQSRFFLSQFSSDLRTACLPPLQDNPYEDVPPALDAVATRMKFFHDLLYEPPHLVVTNPAALLWPFPNPGHLKSLFLEIGSGEILGRDRLIELLDNYGYRREAVVNSHGEFAWRGGIVDVFSPWQDFPYRIEFGGDRVSSLREFDLSSQRSVRKVDRLTIPALLEFPFSPSFVDDWERAVRESAPLLPVDAVKKTVQDLRGGEIPPAFYSLSLLASKHTVPFHRYLKNHLFILDDSEELNRKWEETLLEFHTQHQECQGRNRPSLPPEKIFSSRPWAKTESEAVRVTLLSSPTSKKTIHFPFQSVPRFDNKIPFFLEYLRKSQADGDQTFVFFSGDGVRRKLASLLSQHQIPSRESSDSSSFAQDGAVTLHLGTLSRGFGYPQLKLSFFSEQDIFTEEKVLVSRPRIRAFVSQFRDLKAEDYVVHTDYGVGIFMGLIKMVVDEKNREFIEIHYRDDDKLYVPVEDLNLVQKYSSLGSSLPFLNKLGTPNWERTKERTKKAIENMAKELLQLYAQRRAVQGIGFSPGGAWQDEFDKTFEYEETEDQKKAIEEIMLDMESASPMDRLLCGDVGYGKTEVAIRAAFKAVMDGKQVAVLCPTTVLASQHQQTFRNRMILFPVRVESLTRLQTKTQQTKILEDLRKGLVDIIIGTHRLLSRDVKFKDLGLLVIDEEQRFGVKHKEKLKQMRTNIDVLTMTATPIPRTLNLSLSGLRDISLIETPPKDRLAIHTVVTPFSRKLITSAIRTELTRRGQVYFIHNRVDDIESIAGMIEHWVPEAKVAEIHGQMSGLHLEKRMIDFIQRKYNVLVSTTIIENGIDIPLVNTLIVNRADRFGLAQLYQLRGRVGRSSRQAVSYFLVPPYTDLTPLAKERLKALKEFSELGSGFRLAAKDLEIRGAGNFLGSQQHGYMEAVGFEYYMHLLEQTVKRLKGEREEEIKTELNLKVNMQIPEEYLPQMNMRLNLYKSISSAETLEGLNKIEDEIRDRFGPIPESVKNLLRYGSIKWLSQKIRIKAIDRIGSKMIFKFFPSSSADVSRMTRLLQEHSGTITPQGVLSLLLKAEDERDLLDETIGILKELTLM